MGLGQLKVFNERWRDSLQRAEVDTRLGDVSQTPSSYTRRSELQNLLRRRPSPIYNTRKTTDLSICGKPPTLIEFEILMHRRHRAGKPIVHENLTAHSTVVTCWEGLTTVKLGEALSYQIVIYTHGDFYNSGCPASSPQRSLSVQIW